MKKVFTPVEMVIMMYGKNILLTSGSQQEYEGPGVNDELPYVFL